MDTVKSANEGLASSIALIKQEIDQMALELENLNNHKKEGDKNGRG